MVSSELFDLGQYYDETLAWQKAKEAELRKTEPTEPTLELVTLPDGSQQYQLPFKFYRWVEKLAIKRQVLLSYTAADSCLRGNTTVHSDNLIFGSQLYFS